MSTTNIPVFIGRRSVSSVCAKTHVQTVSMKVGGCSVDKNSSGVTYVNRSSVYKMPTRDVIKYETGNFDIYDAFSDKFTTKNFKEEKTTHVPCVTTKVFSDKFTTGHITHEKTTHVKCGTTINTVNKDLSKKGEVLKRKKICVELKTRNKENSLKNCLPEISTNVTKSNTNSMMLTMSPMRKSNLIQIVLDENKNEKFQEEDNGKKLEEQTETRTKSIKNSDFKKMKRKKKLKQTNKPPLKTKKGKSSGEKVSKCLDVGKDVTKRKKLNKDEVNISESSKTTSCIGSVKRKLKRKRGNSTSSNSTDSAISHSLNTSHSRYGSRRSHSRDRGRRSHSRDRDRCSDSRHQYTRSYCKDRESSSYSPDPYKQRGRYLHSRHSTDSQSSDSGTLSDSPLPCSDDQSQNRSEYLDELDSYAREQLKHSKYNNSRYPPHMYPTYGDIHYSSYSGHRSKYSRNRSRSSDGTISENYSSSDSYCCDSQAYCSHRKRLVISRSGGKRFVTFRSDRTHSRYKSGYKRKRSPRSGSKGFSSLGCRSRVNRSTSPCSRVKPRRSSRSRSRGKSSSRSVSHGKDSVGSCSRRMQPQTSTFLAERSPRSRYRRKQSSKSRTHTSSSKLISHVTKIPRPLSSSDKMKSRTSGSSHKVKKNEAFICEKLGKLEDKFNENRKNIEKNIQQFSQKVMYLNIAETNSDTRNTPGDDIKIKPGDLDSIVIISNGEPEAEVVVFKNGVEENSRVMGQKIKELSSDIQKNISDLILKPENKEETHIGVSMLTQKVNSPITSKSCGLISSNCENEKQKCGKNTDTTKQKINLTNRLPRIMNMRKTISINSKRLQKIKRKKSPKISKEIKSINFTSDRLELSTLIIEIGQDLHKIWNEYFEN